VTWTRGEFAADVRGFAAGLAVRGVDAGNRVALVLPNCPEFLIAWSAIASLGAVAVCLDPLATSDDLGYVDGNSGPRAVVVAAGMAATAGHAIPAADVLDLPDLGATPHPLQRFSAEPEARRPVAHDAPASIQYTSGTTARPKAVVWTQANCLWAGQVGAAHQGLTPEDVNLLHLPLFHTNGLSTRSSPACGPAARSSWFHGSRRRGSGRCRCGTARRGPRSCRSAYAPWRLRTHRPTTHTGAGATARRWRRPRPPAASPSSAGSG
jgi:acyl-CoA synthetase (AMP-forming)/AMP-acid ligase II